MSRSSGPGRAARAPTATGAALRGGARARGVEYAPDLGLERRVACGDPVALAEAQASPAGGGLELEDHVGVARVVAEHASKLLEHGGRQHRGVELEAQGRRRLGRLERELAGLLDLLVARVEGLDVGDLHRHLAVVAVL